MPTPSRCGCEVQLAGSVCCLCHEFRTFIFFTPMNSKSWSQPAGLFSGRGSSVMAALLTLGGKQFLEGNKSSNLADTDTFLGNMDLSFCVPGLPQTEFEKQKGKKNRGKKVSILARPFRLPTRRQKVASTSHFAQCPALALRARSGLVWHLRVLQLTCLFLSFPSVICVLLGGRKYFIHRSSSIGSSLP